ncbi:MAG: hypothetical protein BWX54_02039 [Verrucomicrobia bacterium ADurb.Bin018]|nr:MAG: hypothetical protein BWX54_02039 [Verrucomicrobia bacterium ADurb.Bin018]
MVAAAVMVTSPAAMKLPPAIQPMLSVATMSPVPAEAVTLVMPASAFLMTMSPVFAVRLLSAMVPSTFTPVPATTVVPPMPVAVRLATPSASTMVPPIWAAVRVASVAAVTVEPRMLPPAFRMTSFSSDVKAAPSMLPAASMSRVPSLAT